MCTYDSKLTLLFIKPFFLFLIVWSIGWQCQFWCSQPAIVMRKCAWHWKKERNYKKKFDTKAGCENFHVLFALDFLCGIFTDTLDRLQILITVWTTTATTTIPNHQKYLEGKKRTREIDDIYSHLFIIKFILSAHEFWHLWRKFCKWNINSGNNN